MVPLALAITVGFSERTQMSSVFYYLDRIKTAADLSIDRAVRASATYLENSPF